MASQAEVDLLVNATGTLSEIERDLNRIVTRAEAGADDIDVNASMNVGRNITALHTQLTRLIDEADSDTDPVTLRALLDQQDTLATLQRSLNQVTAQANSGGGVDPVQMRAVLDGPATLRAINADLRRITAEAQARVDDVDVNAVVHTRVDDDDDVNGFLRRLGRGAAAALGPLGSLGISIGVVGAAAGTAAPLLAGVALAVESIIPAAALAAPGLLALGLAGVTVKLAMQGVGDAVKSAFDPEISGAELTEALEKLAPSARAFVLELRGMRGELKEIQQGVQQRFFQGLDTDFRQLATEAGPAVERALFRVSTSLNNMAQGALNAATELADSGSLGRSLQSATRSIALFEDVPGRAVTAFGQLAEAASPAFERVAKAARDALDGVFDSLDSAFESGALEEAINTAVDNIAQLGDIAGNVFGGLGNIIGAVAQDGEGLFSVLEELSQAFEDVTGSGEVQAALRSVSEVMGQLAEAAGPLLQTAIKIVAEVLTTLAVPANEVIRVLGDALGPILDELRPVLVSVADSFGELVIALLPLVEVAGELIADFLPALIPLFEALGEIFVAAAPFIQQFADNLGVQLKPLLEALVPILEEILPPFIQLAETVFPVLTEVLAELNPYLAQFFEFVALGAETLAPLIGLLLEFVALGAGILIETLGAVIAKFFELAGMLKGEVSQALREYIIPAVQAVAAIFRGDWSGAMDLARQAALNFTSTVIGYFNNFKASVTDAVRLLVSGVLNSGESLRSGFIGVVQRLISDMLNRFNRLPLQVVSAISSLRGMLERAGFNAMMGFLNGILSMQARIIGAAKSIASAVIDTIEGALSIGSPSRRLFETGEDTMAGFDLGLESKIPELRRTLTRIALEVQSPDFQFDAGGGRVISIPDFTVPAPTVYVTIGNEAVDQYVTTRVEEVSDDRARTQAKGTRR